MTEMNINMGLIRLEMKSAAGRIAERVKGEVRG